MSNPGAPEQLSSRPAFESPDPPREQITLGKSVLPNQPGLPASVSHLVPLFLLGSGTARRLAEGAGVFWNHFCRESGRSGLAAPRGFHSLKV